MVGIQYAAVRIHTFVVRLSVHYYWIMKLLPSPLVFCRERLQASRRERGSQPAECR
jgi:hypothetical protein